MNKKFERIKLPLEILKDVIIQLLPEGKFLFFNTLTRNNLVCESDTLLLCQELIAENEASRLTDKYKDSLFKIWDVEYFSNEDGLLADPTRINWKSLEQSNYLSLNLEEVVSLLLKKNILVEDIRQYRSLFRLKTNILDTTNLGNFHQQLGYHLIINRKTNPVEWWLGQIMNNQQRVF